MPENPVFETERLTVRIATVEDAWLYLALWTDGRVMANVGFPRGLRIDQSEIEERLARQGQSPLGALLVARLKATGEAIGECTVVQPDEDGIVEPDVKLLPQFWGHKYGAELFRGIVDYQFTHTDCTAVQTTPNVNNTGSIKMQEAIGGVRVGESVFEFPESMRPYTTPVHHYVYRMYREEWARRRAG